MAELAPVGVGLFVLLSDLTCDSAQTGIARGKHPLLVTSVRFAVVTLPPLVLGGIGVQGTPWLQAAAPLR